MVVFLYGYGGHETEMKYLIDSIGLKIKYYSLIRENTSNSLIIHNSTLTHDFQVPRLR